jgi:hypothetical protein
MGMGRPDRGVFASDLNDTVLAQLHPPWGHFNLKMEKKEKPRRGGTTTLAPRREAFSFP